MMKRILSMSVFAGLLMMPAVHYGAVINVFLDNGTKVTDSSNSDSPFLNNTRDSSWDVTATAESGLADVGVAVMTVRMVTLNASGDSRMASTGGGNGLAVNLGSNGLWFDGSVGEAALFQFSFYSDLGKTTEVSGLDLSFISLVSRVASGATKMADAFVGSGELSFGSATVDNNTDVLLGGTVLSSANDTANSFDSALGIKSSSDTLAFYTMTAAVGSIDSFSEDDSLWIRRRNTTVGDDAYQMGGLSLNVVPEPSSLGLCGVVAVGMFMIRRLRM